MAPRKELQHFYTSVFICEGQLSDKLPHLPQMESQSPLKGDFTENQCKAPEHNFLLRTVLDNVRHSRKQCTAAWLDDLTNAFGMPDDFLGLACEFYNGCSTTNVKLKKSV